MSTLQPVRSRIESLIGQDRVVLFMKGDRTRPQCGFSATAVQILDELIDSYATVDVLSDPEIRQGIKAYSDWPTIPQLYVDGEFIGGCDIMREMFAKGDLHAKLGVKVPESVVPTIEVTEAAAAKLGEAMSQADGGVLRLQVDSHFRHQLYFGEPSAHDVQVTAGGVSLHIDAASSRRADGVRIDFVDGGLRGAGFKIDNPNAPAQVRQLSPKELAAKLEQQAGLYLIDVRSPEERALAQIAGSKPLDAATSQEIEALPKDTELVFYCHVGGRSQAAAEHFLAQGFTRAANLAGGIDAWSLEVDPSVPRY